MSTQLIVVADSAEDMEKLKPALDFMAVSHEGKPTLIQPDIQGFLAREDLNERRYSFTGWHRANDFVADMKRAAVEQNLILSVR